MWLAIVDYYRARIRDGRLENGARLAPLRDIAEEWGVSAATVARALRRLVTEQLLATSSQGAVVVWGQNLSGLPQPPGGSGLVIRGAELLPAPEFVAQAMSLELGTVVVRREAVTRSAVDQACVERSVRWIRGCVADSVPQLLSSTPIVGGTSRAIAEQAGYTVQRNTWRECASRADAATAEALGVAEGSPVVYGQNWCTSEDGIVLEFGESFLCEGQWVPTL